MQQKKHVTLAAGMESLVLTFGAALRNYFRRRIAHQPDVDDLVQEVFVRLLSRGGLDDVDNKEGYVFLTASNLLRERYRRRITGAADKHQPLEEDIAESSAFSPERILQGREELARLKAALLELPGRTQDVVMLCCLDGYTHEEAAEDLGISARSVRNHLAKALKHLGARREEWK